MTGSTGYQRSASGIWIFAALAVAAATGLLLPEFTTLLRTLGRHIPQDNIERDYLVGLVWALVAGLSIRFWPIPESDKRPLLLIWCAKVVVTLGVMLIYEWNYTLDAYGYYERSTMAGFPEGRTAWHLGSVTVARIAWLQGRVLPDSYHALKITFALVGMIGVYLIYRGGIRWWPRGQHLLLYWLGLFPSVLFWSSIVGKDPIQLLGIGLYVYGVLSWRFSGRSRYSLFIAAGIGLSMLIRSWSGLILAFPLLVFAAIGLRRPLARAMFTVIALVSFLWTIQNFAGTFRIETLRDIQAAAEIRSRGWAGGSAQNVQQDFSSPGRLLAFAPVGAFSALFRPLPGEVRNLFGMIAGIENLFLLGLVAVAVFRTRLRELKDPALLWAVALILTWSALYAFVSFYNFGAAVRFKLQILPVLLLVLLRMARRERGVAATPAPIPSR